jgi:hypothetical protein
MLKNKASAYLSLLILLVLASSINAQCPTPSIVASSNSICLGNSTTLTVLSGAGASNALNFDGVNDYMATNFDCDVNVVPVTTWEAWVYPTAQNGNWQMIMSIEDGGFLVPRSAGLGKLIVNGASNRDYTLVLGLVVLVTFVAVLFNLLVDLAYALLDPKIRY